MLLLTKTSQTTYTQTNWHPLNSILYPSSSIAAKNEFEIVLWKTGWHYNIQTFILYLHFCQYIFQLAPSYNIIINHFTFYIMMLNYVPSLQIVQCIWYYILYRPISLIDLLFYILFVCICICIRGIIYPIHKSLKLWCPLKLKKFSEPYFLYLSKNFELMYIIEFVILWLCLCVCMYFIIKWT